jgi:hypothetical protein
MSGLTVLLTNHTLADRGGSDLLRVAPFGLGPLVTAADFDRLRRVNFGIRTLRLPLTVEAVLAEIARYDAAAISQRVRATAGREEAVDTLLTLYRGVLDRWQHAPLQPDVAVESRAAAQYLRALTSTLQRLTLDRAAATAAETLAAQPHERISGLTSR